MYVYKMRVFLILFLLVSPVYSSCPMGYKFVSSGIGCVPCEAGTYQDQATQSFTCKNCLPGTYQPNTGQISCTDCSVGRYQPSHGQTSCLICAAGKYQDASGQISCTNCLAGRYQSQSGQQNCDPCPLGTFQNVQGQTSCIDCPVGKYQDKMGYTFCESCGVGEMQNQTGQKQCKCDVGYFSDFGICTECPAGKYQDELDQTECKECERGYYQNETAQQTCIQCEGRVGTAQSGSTSHDECSICLPGSYTYYVNGVLSECRDCEVGKFQTYETQESCNNCQPGTYSDIQGAVTCQTCAVGQYQDQHGEKDCKDCGKGKYQFRRGSDSCLYCPNGRSHILTAQTSPEACIAFYQKVREVPQPVVYTKECEIRDGFTIQCPVCSCFDDSRRGHFDGPICQQCVRGFSTASCKPKCPGYDTINDQTLCSNLGVCYFGKQGDSVCYCGADGSVDDGSDNIVVDVRDNGLERYFKTYTLDFSVIRIEMGMQWKPTRPMKFELFSESTIRQNQCSKCLTEPSEDAPNGYTASNCQYECSNCLFSGKCDNTPRLGQTNTICSCRSIAYGTEDLCCPKGFRPYIEDTKSLPYIKRITPSETPYYLDDVFYGNEKDLCRPCPGLFGLGVEESETFLVTPKDATNFWWTKPLAAFTKSCNAMGTCDFYHDKTSFMFSDGQQNTDMCLTFRPPNKQPTGAHCTSHQDCVSGYCDLENRWGCFQRCLKGVERLIPSSNAEFAPENDTVLHIPNSYFNAFNDSFVVEKKISGSCTHDSECYSGVCGYAGSCNQRCLTEKAYDKNTSKVQNVSIYPIHHSAFDRFMYCWKQTLLNKYDAFKVVSDNPACVMYLFSETGTEVHDLFVIRQTCNEDPTPVMKETYRPTSLNEFKEKSGENNLFVLLQDAIDMSHRMLYNGLFLYEDYVVLFRSMEVKSLEGYDTYELVSPLNELEQNCQLEEDLPVFTYEDGLDPVLGGVCPKGYYCYDGFKVPCPAGYYSELEGSQRPFERANLTTDTNFICKQCPPGKSTLGLNGQARCVDCPTGRYVSNEGEDCALCPVNTYQPISPLKVNGIGACIKCSNSTPTSLPGSVSESQCSSCGPGKGVFGGNLVCKECEVGHASANGICQACETGQYQDKKGQQKCIKCIAGRFQSQKASISCQNCAVGRYQSSESQSSCLACPAGNYQSQTGRTSCIICPAGRYQGSTGASSCPYCPPSHFAGSSGSTSCDRKKTCARGTSCSNRGYYVSKGGGTTENRECTYCPHGRLAVFTNHNKCHMTGVRLSSEAECTSGDWRMSYNRYPRDCFYDYDRYQPGGSKVFLAPRNFGTCWVEQATRSQCHAKGNSNYDLYQPYNCDYTTFKDRLWSQKKDGLKNCDATAC